MKRVLIIAIVIPLVVIGGLAAWRLLPTGQSFFTDAGTINEPATTAPVRDILWEPPLPLAEPINVGVETYEPRLSNDGTTLYFVRGKAGQNADIYLATRTREGWVDPQPIEAINSPADELGPEISADSGTLYFYSNRAGGLGGYDLWVSRRGANGAWREPLNLGPQVNSSFNDYGAALTADGRTLYFSSNRPQPGDQTEPDPDAWSATLREQIFSRTYDLYMVQFTDSGPGTARPLDLLNTPQNEGAPAVSAFGDFVYFASDRPNGQGGFDLYRSRMVRGEFFTPENLGATVNTTANELDPALSMNGFGLDFSSNRTPPQADAVAGHYRLYHTNSREVFLDTQYERRAAIDWAALWRAVGPNLLWALLALTLLLLMLLFFKGAQNRKLSLMAKCVLASLAMHLLLMILFNVWEVAAALAGDFQRGSTIKVALAGPASHSIAAQLTGSLTDVSTPAITIETIKAQEVHEALPQLPFVETPLERKSIEFAAAPPPKVHASDAPPITIAAITPDYSPATPPSLQAISVELPAVAQRVAVEEPNNKPVAPQQNQTLRSTTISTSDHAFAPPEASLDPPRRGQLTASALVVEIPIEDMQDSTPTAKSIVASNAFSPPTMPTLPTKQSELARLPEAAPRPLQSESQQPFTPSPALEGTTRATSSMFQEAISASGPVPETSLAPARSIMPEPTSLMSAASHVRDSVPVRTPALAGLLRLPNVQPTPPVPMNTAIALPGAPKTSIATKTESEPGLDLRPSMTMSSSRVNTSITETIAPLERVNLDATLSRVRLAGEPTVSSKKARVAVVDSQVNAVPTRLHEPFPQLSRADSLPSAVELALPDELSPPENPYPQRTAEDRLENVKRMGGSEATEAAVALALEWLARHQSSDGHWDADGFDANCGDCGGSTTIAADHALTGLGLLCFLGAGHTHTEPGPYQDNVDRAIAWLIARQKKDGDLRGGKETMYTQGIATIALAESYAMTADGKLADPVRRAAGFIYRARNPQAGGWRYDPGQPGDSSVLGWQVMALKSAMRAGIPVPDHAFTHASEWLGRVSRREKPGLYSYQPGEDVTPSMTAESLFVQQLLGLTPTEPRMVESVDFVMQHLPDWNAEAPTYFWYYASLALFQHQGDAWRQWNTAMSGELIEHQRRDGKAAGSWDPSDQWSRLGGRVYQTAICTLMLEVYYRYLPMYGEDALADTDIGGVSPETDEIIGIVRGTVTDKASREPLAGAQVRLVLSDRDTLTATTDRLGRYSLEVPATPDFFALSASLEPFVPQTISVERSRLEGGRRLTVNFSLEPGSRNALVTESAPDVHHLGDDRFSGDINSQFQKKSEGAEFTISFEIAPDALAGPLEQAEVRLMTKGVQRRHKLFVNDKMLERRLDNSPRDGSFGEFVATFDSATLVPGRNSLRVEALPSEDDIDDFEFVNIRVYLVPPTGPDLGQGASIRLDSSLRTH